MTTYFAEDDFIDESNIQTADEISGLTFQEIKQKDGGYSDYVKQFWTYALNIEYLYEQKEELVASVFDRLNRNGEPLTRQELRNAKYADSKLISCIKELTQEQFWNDKLSRLKSVRMEDIEFISELLFLVMEGKILESSQDVLDNLYEKHKNSQEGIDSARKEFEEIIVFIEALDLDYTVNKRLCWTTHLYSLFSLAWQLHRMDISPSSIKKAIGDFYTEYFSRGAQYTGALEKYKEASSSRTRSDTQRRNRLSALLDYCQICIDKK